MKYNWDSILERAQELAPLCETFSQLAERLGIPTSSLRGGLKRLDISFADLLMGATQIKQTTIEKLLLQKSFLEKELMQLQKQVGYNEWFSEALMEAASMLKPETVKPPLKSAKAETLQSAVLLLSDIHLGQQTPAEEVGVFGKYNSEIAAKMIKHTFTAFAGMTKQQAFPVDEVYVFGLGDWVEHAHMRPGHEAYVDTGVVKQALAITNLTIAGLKMLCSEFSKVTLVGVSGNHGRVTSDPRRSKPTENFDYMCYKMLEMAFKDQPNIDFIIPESWYTNVKIQGYNFFATHGENIRSYVGFPWYGATRAARKYVAMFRLAQKRKIEREKPQTVEEWESCMIVPDYALLAHFHTEATWAAPDIEHFANGAMPGVSQYGAKNVMVINKPSQRMFFVHPKYGVAFRCPIDLDWII